MARVEAGVPDGEERVPVVGATRRGAGTRRRCGAAKSLLALPSDATQPAARVVLSQHEAWYSALTHEESESTQAAVRTAPSEHEHGGAHGDPRGPEQRPTAAHFILRSRWTL